MAKRKSAKKVRAIEAPHEPSAKERVGWQIGNMAETMVLAHPTVQKIRARITAKLEKMADRAMGSGETPKQAATKRPAKPTKKAAS